MVQLGVLVPQYNDKPTHPSQSTLGRSALRLAPRGVQLIFAAKAKDGVITGTYATEAGYVPCEVTPAVVFDRFPCQSQKPAHQALIEGLQGVPVLNHPDTITLCRDKWRCYQLLDRQGIAQPELVREDLDAALVAFEKGFVKPRHGALGRGVRLVQPSDSPLPTTDTGADGQPDEMLLQRAIEPAPGLAGHALRVLVQRLPSGDFWAYRPVSRTSFADPVVNACRGASVSPVRDIDVVRRAQMQAEQIAHIIDEVAGPVIELGVDFVMDRYNNPICIEVNGRPRGRLSLLAEQDAAWVQAHEAAIDQPMITLSRIYG